MEEKDITFGDERADACKREIFNECKNNGGSIPAKQFVKIIAKYFRDCDDDEEEVIEEDFTPLSEIEDSTEQ